MSTVLVTGCAGYVGSVLTGELLAAGHKVIGVDYLLYDNGRALGGLVGNPGFEFHRHDVCDRTTMRTLASRADVVIPLAALVGAPVCKKHPDEATKVNYQAVKDLADDCSPAQLVLYPNTNSGYGQTAGDEQVTEESPMNPISVYGVTKCNAEKAVLDRGGVAFRLATVFGVSPRMRFDLMVNDFVATLGRVWLQHQYPNACFAWTRTMAIYEPHFKRNFVHVRDVSRAFIRFATAPAPRGVYNLGLESANLTKWQLAERVCRCIGLDPADSLTVAPGTDPDQRNYVVSNAKLNATGFACEHGLDAGIREVYEYLGFLTEGEIEDMRNA